MPETPAFDLPAWGLRPDHVFKLVGRRLGFVIAFDVISFIALSRSLGVQMELGTRAEAARAQQKFGKTGVPTWAHRPLHYEIGPMKNTVLSGMLGRLMHNLTNPVTYIGWLRDMEEQFGEPE